MLNKVKFNKAGKKITLLIFLFVSITAPAQNDAVEDTVAKPAITAIGKPDGGKTEMIIGKEGGSFISSDGKVTLLIPEGAVLEKTVFSIQPTTNLMPAGNGKAYQMEPSGINFKKPLQIIFNYSNDETQGNSPLLMGLAMQDDKGIWFALNKTVLDSLAKTLTAAIHHFSAYVNFSKAKISPASARVKVNGSLRLKIVGAFWDDTDDDEVLPLGIVEYPNMNWSVNGIAKGNSSIGIISASQSGSAIFQAPAQIPEQNPVAVTVGGYFSSSFINKWGVEKLVSNITIYDDVYEVKMVTGTKGGSLKAWGGITTSRDEGSFNVSLGKKKATVVDIKNNFEVVTDNCTKTILNPATCTGPIHVAGVKHIQVTPANPPLLPYPIVEIWFVPYPTEVTRFNYISCPPPQGFKGDPAKAKMDFKTLQGYMALVSMSKGPSLPIYLKFEAKEGEYIFPDYNYNIEKNGSQLYMKFTVKQIKENQ